jgi:peptide subunit release factor 1 (eRF1)/intein/homing endonuclease
MAIDAKTKFDLKKFVKMLKTHRGRHTELISVYVSAGFDLTLTINQLQQEAGTASNIKSAGTRNNVISALERMVQFLKQIKQTPPNGLAVFSGNVSDREGGQDFQVFHVEPPIPLAMKLYRCDKTFVTDPLEEMTVDKETYGLVVLDQRDATIAILKGKAIIPLKTTHSEVPGKMRAGGQCLFKKTLIQMTNGEIKAIEDVIVGDSVIGFDKKLLPAKVLDTWKAKKQEFILTTKHPKRKIRASKDHIFFVYQEGKIEERTVEHLKEGDTLLFPERIATDSKLLSFNTKQYANRLCISDIGQSVLVEARKKMGLTQKSLGMKLELSQTTISYYEIGKNNAEPNLLKKICAEIELSYDIFIAQYCVPLESVSLPQRLTSEFAQFIGYFLGDGCLETDRVTLFEQRKDVAMSLQTTFNALFNLTASYRFRESKNYHQLRYNSRPLVRMLRSEFPELKKAIDSSIPSKILQSRTEVVASFLKGLFDAEGYVTNLRLGLGVNNELLARQMQQALLRFSIICSIHEYDNKQNPYSDNVRFTIDITEKRSLELFQANVGFTAKDKKALLQDLVSNQSEVSYVRQILCNGAHIREIVGGPTRRFSQPNFFSGKGSISKVAFKNGIYALASDIEKKKLDIVLKNPLLPTKIASITTGAMTDMVDISTETQNFFANGLLVHNSAPRFQRIRQDAVNSHFKKVADYMKDEFLHMKDLKGIIIGGPGTTIKTFMLKDHVTGDLKKKIIATKDLSYTGDFGLQELLERSADVLASEEVQKEKLVMQDFFKHLSTDSGKSSYGKDDCERLINMGAVEKLLLSESNTDELIEHFELIAEEQGTEVCLISTETREGGQLASMGGIAAILRYNVNQ